MPLVVWLILIGRPVAAFWIFVLAGISDAVDGLLARQFNLRSDLGAYLDPVADKTLLVSIYVTLPPRRDPGLGDDPDRQPRRAHRRRRAPVVDAGPAHGDAPAAISKVNTPAQIILAAVVLGDLAFRPDLAALQSASTMWSAF